MATDKKISTLMARITKVRAEELILAARLKTVEAERKAMQAELMQLFISGDHTSIRHVAGALATISPGVLIIAEDWALIDRWAIKKKMPTVYQRRLHQGFVKEVFDGGDKVDGVKVEPTKTLVWTQPK